MPTNPETEATPITLELNRRNVLNWDYRVDFLGRAPHSLIAGDDFTCREGRHAGATSDSLITRGDGLWRFVTSAEPGMGNQRVSMAGRAAGPVWVAYVIVEKMSRPASGVNLIDVGVALFNSVLTESKTIRARLWSTEARCDLCVAIDQSPYGIDSNEWGTTAFEMPEGAFSLALVCNLNSLAVAIGDANGQNFRIASGWHTLTGFDMASEVIRFGSPGDGNGGLYFNWYCESSTVGSEFVLSKAEWRYWDGVGTRETYLLSDIDGSPIVENGKVWMTTDRTLPYDPATLFLPSGAQIIACQYDPSNGQLGPETARYFYEIDGRTTQAQNCKLVWEREANRFHFYIPDWKEAGTNGVRMLYACVENVDLRYGVHVIHPTPLSLPTGEHFDFDPAHDFLFDASMVRIGEGDFVLLVTWHDDSRSGPLFENYSRVMFRGNSPSNFPEIVGWDENNGGEGHRIVMVGGKRWAICGALERNSFNTWEIIPNELGENWMVYVGNKVIAGFDWARGDIPHYPSQPEIFGLPSRNGVEYHFTTFGAGQFDAAMNATTGSFFAAKSQEFPIL